MLPDIELDSEKYEEIIEETRNKIISLYPEWTDFNYHDPGITMIELFSWIKEIQEYYLNQIGEEGKKKYLKLLGIKQKHKECAEAMVSIAAPDDFIMLKGSKLYAGNVCFENTEKKFLLKDDIAKCFYATESIQEYIDRQQLNFSSKLRLFMFGKQPKKDDCFYIGFDLDLPVSIELSIYLGLLNDYRVTRNPVGDFLFSKLADLEFEYMCEEGWKKIEQVEDNTYGLIQSGFIKIKLMHPMVQIKVFEEEGYFLRIKVVNSFYDVPPVLEQISINSVKVQQKKTIFEVSRLKKSVLAPDGKYEFYLDSATNLRGSSKIYYGKKGIYYCASICETFIDMKEGKVKYQFDSQGVEVEDIIVVSNESDHSNQNSIGVGNGFPFQEIDLRDENIEYESFELLIEDIGKINGYSLWEKVDDFGNSKPEDRHYVFDSKKGIIYFGDCIHGMAPEGEIVVISYVRNLGSGGNVSANKINRMADVAIEQMHISNSENAYGGRAEESLEDSIIRARKELKHSITAVTYEDYEQYVKQTPGLMIDSCRVLDPTAMKMQKIKKNDETVINIVVRPYSFSKVKKLSERYQRNIINYMEQFRMIGAKINLMAPEYINFEVYIYVKIKPYYIDAKERIIRVIEEFFENMHDKFGADVIYSELYGVIDILDCVCEINSLDMEARGNGVVRNQDGNIKLPPNGVAEVGNIQYLFNTES